MWLVSSTFTVNIELYAIDTNSNIYDFTYISIVLFSVERIRYIFYSVYAFKESCYIYICRTIKPTRRSTVTVLPSHFCHFVLTSSVRHTLASPERVCGISAPYLPSSRWNKGPRKRGSRPPRLPEIWNCAVSRSFTLTLSFIPCMCQCMRVYGQRYTLLYIL